MLHIHGTGFDDGRHGRAVRGGFIICPHVFMPHFVDGSAVPDFQVVNVGRGIEHAGNLRRHGPAFDLPPRTQEQHLASVEADRVPVRTADRLCYAIPTYYL